MGSIDTEKKENKAGEQVDYSRRLVEYREWCLWNPWYHLETDYPPHFQKHNIPYLVG